MYKLDAEAINEKRIQESKRNRTKFHARLLPNYPPLLLSSTLLTLDALIPLEPFPVTQSQVTSEAQDGEIVVYQFFGVARSQ